MNMALFIKFRPIIGAFRSLSSYRPIQAFSIGNRPLLSTSLLSNQIRLNYEIAEAKILPQSTMNEVRSPSLRTLDRNISSFEERSQRNERVGEKGFIKIFDLYSRVIQGLGSDVSKIEPDVASNITLYTNILLRCCGKLMLDTPPKRRELLAGNLWLFVKERSIPIDISHYNSLIRVMNENETAYEPKKILEEISAYGFKPDRITYQRLIHQYCLQGDISGATNLLEKMKDLSMDLSEQIFASLIIGYSKQPNCPTIKELFDLMHSNGVEPNSSSYCAAFTTLASKLDKDPKASEQIEELCKMYEKDEVRLAVNDLFDVTISLTPFRSKYEFVDKFLATISDSLSVSIPSRYRFLTMLIRANEFDRASTLFWSQKINERALRAGNNGLYWIKALAINHNVPIEFAINECQMLKDREYNLKPFHQLFYAAADIGRMELVRAALKSMTETEPLKIHYIWPLIARADSEGELIQVLKNDLNPLMDSNDLVETFSWWVWPKFSDKAERLFELNKDLKYDNNILMASFLNFSVQENKFAEALKFISEAPSELVNESTKDQQDGDEDLPETDAQATPRTSRSNDRGNLIARLLNQIVDQTKDPELVKKAFSMCQVPGQPVSTRSLAALIRVHLLNDDYDRALEEFLKINHEYRVSPCRAELMRHCLETKNPEKLQKIMNCMTENYGEQNSLFDLAVCCLRSSKLKQAQKIFASPGFRVRPARIYQTCRSMARKGEVDILENFVSLTRDMYDVNQEYLYQVLIDTYERTSNAKRALHLWNMMQEEEFQPSKKSLLMIANILERNNIEVPFQKPKANFLETGAGRGSTERRGRET